MSGSGAGPRTLVIATRGSALARWQAAHVAGRLGRPTEELVVETAGDRQPEVPIAVIGGQGVFAKAVQEAVLDRRADLAVHSAKDLPPGTTEGLVLAAVPERGDARDALVGCTLEDLAPGARVATGSARRRAQLAWVRPDLTFADLRGNIGTRLARVPPGGAVVVAATALQRLGHEDRAAELLDPVVMLPQVGQGALAVECRAGDTETREALAALDHRPSRRSVEAERAFLLHTAANCDLPLAAHCTMCAGDSGGDGPLELEALLASLDGRILLRHRARGQDPEALGRALAEELLGPCGGSFLAADLGLDLGR